MIGLKGWVGGGDKSQDGEKARSSLNHSKQKICACKLWNKLQIVKTHMIVNGATRFSSSEFFL
jgi:hypothetical protein